jgi:hypothetical protein
MLTLFLPPSGAKKPQKENLDFYIEETFQFFTLLYSPFGDTGLTPIVFATFTCLVVALLTV